MKSKYTLLHNQSYATKPSYNAAQDPEDKGCLLIFFFAILILCTLGTCSFTYAYEPSSSAKCISVDESHEGDGLEAVVSVWVDMSGSVNGLVPQLLYSHLQPILDVYSHLDAASMSVGKIGASTRSEMSFLSFRKSSKLTPPKRKPGQSPDDYKTALMRFKKRKARGGSGSTFQDKISNFEIATKAILNAPKNESQSQICEAINVSKRQFSQANVSSSTQKFILICSDMYPNGSESCPLTLGDAELIVVNRLSNPPDLVLHSNTQHFISVEEAIDYIVSKL